jgi:hypothetical protein
MAAESVEELLAQVVEQNSEIIDKLSSLLDEVIDIGKELNWAADLTFAKQVVDRLDEVERAIAERS